MTSFYLCFDGDRSIDFFSACSRFTQRINRAIHLISSWNCWVLGFKGCNEHYVGGLLRTLCLSNSFVFNRSRGDKFELSISGGHHWHKILVGTVPQAPCIQVSVATLHQIRDVT